MFSWFKRIKNHLKIDICQLTCCRWIVQQSHDSVLLGTHRCHCVGHSLQHQWQQTILLFGQINAIKVFIKDAVKPGGGEKTLWLSCLPPPNRIPSNTLIGHISRHCVTTGLVQTTASSPWVNGCSNARNAHCVLPPSCHTKHRINECVMDGIDVIDSRWNIF